MLALAAEKAGLSRYSLQAAKRSVFSTLSTPTPDSVGQPPYFIHGADFREGVVASWPSVAPGSPPTPAPHRPYHLQKSAKRRAHRSSGTPHGGLVCRSLVAPLNCCTMCLLL